MATITRQFTFTDNGQARADQWMQDANALWNWINTNVQDVDGSRPYATPPQMGARPPANGNHAVDGFYMDTKLKLEKTYSSDLGYPTPAANTWFIQVGVASYTDYGGNSDPQVTISFPYPFASGTTPLCYFLPLRAIGEEAHDNTVLGRNANGFVGQIFHNGAMRTAAITTEFVSWTAIGWNPSLDWNEDLSFE